jgi:hypothetical protein
LSTVDAIRKHAAQDLQGANVDVDDFGFVDHTTPIDAVISGRAAAITAEVEALFLFVFEVDAHVRGTAEAIADLGGVGVAIGVGRNVFGRHRNILEQWTERKVEPSTTGQQRKRHRNKNKG